MQVELAGHTLHLKPLTDKEYNEAERLARHSSVPLDRCPTCGASEQIIPGSGGAKIFKNGTYRYRSEEFPCDCQAQIALRARYLLANIGDQYMRLDWNDFEGTDAAKHWVAHYIENWESYRVNGMGLLFGSTDLAVGKTFAATTIGKELVKRRQRVYFTDFLQMVDSFMSDGRAEMERRMRETTCLILDDIVGGMSERQQELFALKFEVVIRHRTNFNLPTITTTNLTAKEYEEAYPRIYSLLEAKQIRVDMTGQDQRRTRMREENMEILLNKEVRPIT